MKLKFCDFFSGIGGFRLGLERAGHKGIWACEIEDFPRKVYQKNFGHLPQGKDIKNVRPQDIPKADLWCGGFPCQDLSVAGKQGGLQANRSGLFWVWQELMRTCRPQWLLIENVPGLLSSKGGGDFALLLSSLDKIGYGLSWRVLDAQFFGLAQRRKRLFIVGCLGKTCPPEILFEREGGEGSIETQQEAGGDIAHCLTQRTHKSGDPTTDTYVVTFDWQQGGNASETATQALSTTRTVGVATKKVNTNGMRKATGIPGRLDTPDSPRYKALGNAVAVPVVEWIGGRLLEHA